MTSDIQAALAAEGIVTGWLARLDFAAETIGISTLPLALAPNNTGDALLDGVTFDPLAFGIAVQLGDNSYSYSGSEPLDIVLGVPASVSTEISAANALPAEWQARPATIWRALLKQSNDPLAPPVLQYRRIRTGAMDSVEWSNDGTQINFKLTIESHASLISSASGMTYLNQNELDPGDLSQTYAVSLANGLGFASTVSPSIGGGGGGGGFGEHGQYQYY